jgi:hypothetical protein
MDPQKFWLRGAGPRALPRIRTLGEDGGPPPKSLPLYGVLSRCPVDYQRGKYYLPNGVYVALLRHYVSLCLSMARYPIHSPLGGIRFIRLWFVVFRYPLCFVIPPARG